MLNVRRSEERGHANYGWLHARYTFSFANYFNPDQTGFRDLLVLNQDTIEPSSGFGLHPHKNMEIITYIISGELEHTDSLGNKGVIREGEIQRMSAGSGIRHSEMNPSSDKETNLLQIWINTNKKDLPPDYESVFFEKTPGRKLLVSPDGSENSAKINQDCKFYGFIIEKGNEEKMEISEGRSAWIQVVLGSVLVNGKLIKAGDGVAISEVQEVVLQAEENVELIFIDLK